MQSDVLITLHASTVDITENVSVNRMHRYNWPVTCISLY